MNAIDVVVEKVLGYNMTYSDMAQLEISESAVIKIADILAEENNPNLKLRTFVQGGGCSGMSYGFTLDEIQNEDDFIIEKNGITVLIDSMSMQYLIGATINYKEDLTGNQFVISNPNAQTTCGCGSSFSIG
jgi:iron-sulfur cluster insertion protein